MWAGLARQANARHSAALWGTGTSGASQEPGRVLPQPSRLHTHEVAPLRLEFRL
jgi:hypothetical protein